MSRSPLPNIPNARLGNDLALTIGTAAFGSSQLSGCPGDFCDYDLSFLDRDVGDTVFDERADFRKRLMKSDPVAKRGSVANAATKGNMNRATNSKDAASPRDRNRDRTRESKSKSPSARHRTKSPGGGSAGEEGDCMSIPYRLVIQTRQEAPLVKLLLTRRKRGEEGDYVSEASYTDLALSSQMPEMYTKEVECCNVCYKVSTL